MLQTLKTRFHSAYQSCLLWNPPASKRNLFWTLLWWIGVPVINALIIWAPYWIWNILNQQEPWWRVFIVTSGVFDTYAYLQWLGQAAHGLDIGGSFRWFATPLRWLTEPLLSVVSVPEAWFVTRWISTTVMVWIGSWCFSQWAQLERHAARFFSICFWISLVLVLGMRPGAYSWYLPIGFICIHFVLVAKKSLHESHWASAILYSVFAIFLSSVYSWFLIFTGLWLLTVWSIWLIQRAPRLSRWLFLSGTIVVVVGACFIAPALVASPRWLLLHDFQERLGLAYTHLPYFSNSFLVIIGWLVVWIAYALIVNFKVEERVTEMVSAWIVLLFSWLLSPFTGIYLHNDHFRTTVVMLSWMSLAMLWVLLSRQSSEEWPARMIHRRIAVVILVASFAFTCLYLVRVAIRPYAFDGDTLNVVHMSHWFALAFGAFLLLASKRRIHLARYFFPGLLIGSSLIGGVALAAVYRDVYHALPKQIVYRDSIEWIRKYVPITESMCTDPEYADFFGAHTERRVYPAETTSYLSEPTSEVIKRLIAILGFYNARDSGQADAFDYSSGLGRGTVCGQASSYVPWLKRFGYSAEAIDVLTGCPRVILQKLSDVTTAAINNPVQDLDVFINACPWVIVPTDQQDYWNLPASYEERAFDGVSVWRHIP
jgi:hypothetical protein